MRRNKSSLVLVVILSSWSILGSTTGSVFGADLEGQWYGNGNVPGLGRGTISIAFSETSFGAMAQTNIPGLGLFDTGLPAMVEETQEGTVVTISVPGFLEMTGVIGGEFITGEMSVIYGGGAFPGDWFVGKDTGESMYPGVAPGPDCIDLPPVFCTGSAEHCSDLLPFLPDTGPGYIDNPINGETWEDQFRSFLRRDLMHVVKFAAAKVACKATDWEYGSVDPIGLGDSSEADGAIPGTSQGYLGHPLGSHENGKDIDIAYFQLFSPDNNLRPVGVHQPGPFEDAFHLLGPPYALDVWRTALFIAYLSEHPRMRVIGVDGRIGTILEDAFDDLVGYGWIDYDLRESINLAYEEEDTGEGWFRFHHHHMHVSMKPVEDVVVSAEVTPRTLNRKSNGRYVTVRIELEEDFDATQINTDTVGLILDGHTILYAEPWPVEITDYNHNGIPDLTVKFDRQAILESVDTGTVEVDIVGQVDGLFFQEVATIRVIH